MPRFIFAEVIGRLLDGQPSWEKGDSLALIDLRQTSLPRLGECVGQGLQYFAGLTTQERDRWGAVLMIAGAHAFAADREGPRTYETAGRMLGIRDLASAMNASRLDATERGVARYLGIRVLRNLHGRCFVETMVAHSGLDMGVLEACAERVANAWNWAVVESSTLDAVEKFVDDRRASLSESLTTGRRALLDSPEGIRAVAHTLIELATFRREVMSRQLAKTDVAETRLAVGRAGLDPKTFLGAEPSDRLLQIVLGVGRQRGLEPETPSFVWLSTQSYFGLGLTLPRKLAFQEVSPDVDRVRVSVVDSVGQSQRAGSENLYARDGAAFRRTTPSSVIPIAASLSLPLQVLVRFRRGDDDCEVLHSTQELPGIPVTIFHENGEYVDAAPAGTRVILACAPGYSLEASPMLVRVPGPALEFWRATVPSEPVVLTIRDGAGETDEWVFGSEPAPRVEAKGSTIAGLTIARARVFREWPELRVTGFAGRAQLEVRKPSGVTEREDVVCRNGRVRSAGCDAPGLYRVTLQKPGWQTRCRFVVLPPTTRTSVVDQGEAGVLAAIEGLPATLTARDQAAISVRPDALMFKTGTVGVQTASVLIPTLGLEGTWDIPIHPARARVLVRIDSTALDHPIDLSRCNDASVLELSGPPGTTVRLEVDGVGLTRQIGPEGKRLIHFWEMPVELFDEESEVMTATWDGAARKQKLLRFVDPRQMRPILRPVVPGTFQLDARRQLEAPVEVEVVPVARPWEKSARVQASLDEAGKRFWYGFTIPESLAEPVLAGLLELGGMPATGLALIPAKSEDEAEGRSELSRLLWKNEGTRSEVASLLRAAGPEVIEAVASTVNRHGPAFFSVADGLPGSAGYTLLKRFIANAGGAEDGDLGRVLARMGFDMLVATYADMVSAKADIEALPEAEYVDLLDAIAGRGVGLVIPALLMWRQPAWNEQLAERFQEVIAPWAHLAQGGVAAISDEEADLIRTPPDSADRGAFEAVPLNPRAQGLVQARRAEVELAQNRKLREILQRYAGSDGQFVVPEFKLIASRTTKLIPRSTLHLEEAAYACARKVDAWRAGEGAVGDCRTARELGRYCGALLDYWLNYFATQHAGRFT